jgi:hypothetical protein
MYHPYSKKKKFLIFSLEGFLEHFFIFTYFQKNSKNWVKFIIQKAESLETRVKRNYTC